MLIRAAVSADLEQVMAIYGHHVKFGTASFELEPPDLAEILRRHAEVTSKGLPYLVAEEVGRVIGYAYASAYRPRRAYRFTVENSVYLAPDYMGRGIGRRLLTELIVQCENGPWRQMIAIIGDSANTPSIRLHEALGFRHVGVLRNVGWKFDRWLDTVLMQRTLGAGSALPGE